MLNRERETLVSWIESLNQEDQARKTQAQEESARRKEGKELWRKRVQEDVAYLHQIGVIAMLKDATRILRQRWPDVKFVLNKPYYLEGSTYSPYDGSVNVGLMWNYQFKGSRRYGESSDWQAKKVSCRVERDRNSRDIMGLRFPGSGPESIYSEPEEIRQRILTSILEAKHVRTNSPSMVRNIVAHVRNS